MQKWLVRERNEIQRLVSWRRKREVDRISDGKKQEERREKDSVITREKKREKY